jgi:hypothetical protein
VFALTMHLVRSLTMAQCPASAASTVPVARWVLCVLTHTCLSLGDRQQTHHSVCYLSPTDKLSPRPACFSRF